MRNIAAVTGSDDFYKYLQPNNLFVDKSLFIKDIIDNNDDVVIITRPRRWGKSLNMSMLQYFFTNQVGSIDTRGIFDNLKIAQVENGKYMRDHHGKYPVLFISFRGVDGSDYEKAYNDIALLIRDQFNYHRKVILNKLNDEVDKITYEKYVYGDFNESELKKSLEFLTRCLEQCYQQKVYVLIDEYDRPLNTAFNHDHSFRRLTDLIGGLFSDCLKSNPHLEKGIITGVFRIAKAGIFSGLNNACEYTILDKEFCQHYGFTEEEVSELCEKAQVDEPMRQGMREWYNGYKVGGITIYNPWSIMRAINKQELEPFWVDTSNNVIIRNKIQGKYEIQSKLDELITGKSIIIDIDKHITYEQINFNDQEFDQTIWALFLHTGYLTAESIEQTGIGGFYSCQLRIPNLEVKSLYLKDLYLWMNETTGVQFPEFLDCLIKHDIDGFIVGVSEYLSIVFNVQDLAKNHLESFYHAFVAMIVAVLWGAYHIESNRTSGDGFPDLMLIPRKADKKSGIIMEFKRLGKDASDEQMSNACDEALAQIDSQNYIVALKDRKYISEVYKIGMVFSGKKVLAKQECESI